MSTQPPIELITRPEPAHLRSVWPSEASDFTPWLAENLDWLDTLNLGGLSLIDTEVSIPGTSRNLDILAQTPDETPVAIENQYNKTDHDHLTRGLAYAVGHHARALVVISEDHGSEFIAIADYLNEAYEEMGPKRGIAVFLVRLAVERVGSHYVPRFEVVSRPNTWLAEVQSGGKPSRSALLAGFPESARGRAELILNQWDARAGTSSRSTSNNESISLDYPYRPGDTTPRSILVYYTNDTITVNRGYLRENLVDDDHVAELDEKIRQLFPGITNKPYYPSAPTPQPESVQEFADWIIELAT